MTTIDLTAARLLDCGHAPSPHLSFTTGYGINPDTRETACYMCCLARAVIDMECRAADGLPFSCAYSSSASRVVTWPGLPLPFGPITWGDNHPWSRERSYCRVTDSLGRDWHGTGAPSMYLVLRINRH